MAVVNTVEFPTHTIVHLVPPTGLIRAGFPLLCRYGYYEQGGLADMDDEVRVMELVEDTVRKRTQSAEY